MLDLMNFVRGQCPEVDIGLVDRHFRSLPPSYCERHSAAEIARHLRLLATLDAERRVAVEVRLLAPHTFEAVVVGEDYIGTVGMN